MRSYSVYRVQFFAFESLVIVIFTTEYCLRFYSCDVVQSKWNFVKQPMNVVDLLAIAPYYLECLYALYVYLNPYTELSWAAIDDLRALRCLRLARLFKFGRYNTEMSLITQAFLRSSASFFMLFAMLILAMIFFSTLMFTLERGVYDEDMGCYVRRHNDQEFNTYGTFAADCSPYASIPASFWWAITTMTTVGYGDAFPYSSMGKACTGCTMIIGILCVALPTTVLGVQFGDHYNNIIEEKEISRIARSIPDEDMRHDALMDEIRIFQARRAQILELHRRLQTAALNNTDAENSSKVQTQVTMFSESVEITLKQIDFILANIDTQLSINSRQNSPVQAGKEPAGYGATESAM